MKIRPLSTITTSACLGALLTLSANAAVGTVNYPMSAQKAFQTAVSGLAASGWPAAATSVAQAMPTMTTGTTPKADPVMNEELIARLIKYTRGVDTKSSVDKPTCKIFDLCDGTTDLDLQSAEADMALSTDGGKHWFSMPRKADSQDILMLRKTSGLLESFLTDKTGKLRAAAVQSNGVARLITNEKAAEQFKKEMALFAIEASGLPPTGSAVVAK